MTETMTEPTTYTLTDPSFVAGRMAHASTWAQALPESLLVHLDAARVEQHRALMERVAYDEAEARRLAAELEQVKPRDAGARARAVQTGKPLPPSEADAITASLAELQKKLDAAPAAAWSSANELLAGVTPDQLAEVIYDVRAAAFDELRRTLAPIEKLTEAIVRIAELNAQEVWLGELRRETYTAPFQAGTQQSSRALDEISGRLPTLLEILRDELRRVEPTLRDEPAGPDVAVGFTFVTGGPVEFHPTPPRRGEQAEAT